MERPKVAELQAHYAAIKEGLAILMDDDGDNAERDELISMVLNQSALILTTAARKVKRNPDGAEWIIRVGLELLKEIHPKMANICMHVISDDDPVDFLKSIGATVTKAGMEN
jgi:hypothetical protein